VVHEACAGTADVSPEPIIEESVRNLYDGVPEADVATALTMSARTLIEREPNYSYVAARLLLDHLRREALSFVYGQPREATAEEMGEAYADYFARYIQRGVELERLDPKLSVEYDLEALGQAIRPGRDTQFTYLGLQTLYDRYFIHHGDVRFELPQAFFMRVAMGLAIHEVEREARTIEFYNLLSSFDFMSSTPTLFNSGTLRPQLSSCYLTTVPDDLYGIFDSIKDDAMLSKFAGGLGNDWSRVRAMGAHIKGTNGKSQGVVPFLKVANDTAVAVNQGGKRKGAMCAYLETWHLDIEEFIELRKNTGDDRRRTHDMNTANWIPDLFMKRVARTPSGPCSPRTRPGICTTWSGRPSRPAMWSTRPRPSAARSATSRRSRPWTCGARCWACSMRPATHGSPSRIRATCALPNSTRVWSIPPICAPRSPSTPPTTRSPCATSAPSTWPGTWTRTG